jgi:hypothetical protein
MELYTFIHPIMSRNLNDKTTIRKQENQSLLWKSLKTTAFQSLSQRNSKSPSNVKNPFSFNPLTAGHENIRARFKCPQCYSRVNTMR